MDTSIGDKIVCPSLSVMVGICVVRYATAIILLVRGLDARLLVWYVVTLEP
jgi:hypothetical protein